MVVRNVDRIAQKTAEQQWFDRDPADDHGRNREQHERQRYDPRALFGCAAAVSVVPVVAVGMPMVAFGMPVFAGAVARRAVVGGHLGLVAGVLVGTDMR